MTFEEILDQALAMLQRRGRVAYRMLKRQFQLNDDALEDLKAELIKGQRLAVDEDGEVLVWTGGANMQAASIASPPPHGEGSHVDQPVGADIPPAEPRTSDAERRQLTVLFCDLVDSTALAIQLDPEDLREVVRAYQATCAEVIQRFDGHIAQYLGDGLLVYFGYPRAHEDDAQRAVRAGLGMLAAVGQLSACLERDKSMQLAVRIGIHTGLVVVGEIGPGARQEQLALGETPNVAARLQGLAPPNRVVISAHTRQLAGGAFTLEELGLHTLKGVPTPMQVYGIRGERTAETRFEAASPADLIPLVGREEELSLVLQRWAQARAGEGQIVLLAGEPGIGKSRLLQTVRERVAAGPHLRLSYQCLPYYTNSAFYPLIAQLERAARFERDDTPAKRLEELEGLLAQGTERVAGVAPLFAALLSIATGDRYPPLSLSPERQKAQTIAALVDQVAGLSRRQPVLCLVEDAQWCDPTTLEVLDQLVHRVPELRVLVLITYRPEFTAPWTASHITALTLPRLGRAQVAAMVAHLTAGRTLPTEVLAQILARTDGVPLFVEELTKTILESGHLREVGGRYTLSGPLPPLAIPATVQDSLMARLDRLAPVKEVAQLGAALGREFAYELLTAVSPLGEPALHGALAQLVGAGLLFRHGQPPQARYRFKHALVQEAAYASLLKSRRQQLHTRIAMVLEARFPALGETEPEVLAHHYTEAGLPAHAIPYWQRAGQRAIELSAYIEAIAHLTKGLEILKTLSDTPERARQELDLQLTLGPALTATKGNGAPDVERAYARARELCQQLGETPQLFPALLGLRAIYFMRAEFHTARELGEQLLSLAQSIQDPTLLLEAHRAHGTTLFFLGELFAAQKHLEQSIALYDPLQHRAHAILNPFDLGVACRCWEGLTLWLLGYPDQALERSHEALVRAQELTHPYSLVFALNYAAWLHQYRREAQAAQERAEAAITLSADRGFAHHLELGMTWRGWALAAQGREEEGIAQMRQGLAARGAAGADANPPFLLALLAGAYGTAGQAEEGLTVLDEALATAHKTGEGVCEAELYRLQGELLLRLSPEHRAGAEARFQQAIEIARRQQAKSLELRAAMSLSRLWQQQGKRAEARQLLAEVYSWFTEGFDTADLEEAKALLEELSR
jgi:predicted ATPase/class 3 adenylate cyclase